MRTVAVLERIDYKRIYELATSDYETLYFLVKFRGKYYVLQPKYETFPPLPFLNLLEDVRISRAIIIHGHHGIIPSCGDIKKFSEIMTDDILKVVIVPKEFPELSQEVLKKRLEVLLYYKIPKGEEIIGNPYEIIRKYLVKGITSEGKEVSVEDITKVLRFEEEKYIISKLKVLVPAWKMMMVPREKAYEVFEREYGKYYAELAMKMWDEI